MGMWWAGRCFAPTKAILLLAILLRPLHGLYTSRLAQSEHYVSQQERKLQEETADSTQETHLLAGQSTLEISYLMQLREDQRLAAAAERLYYQRLGTLLSWQAPRMRPYAIGDLAPRSWYTLGNSPTALPNLEFGPLFSRAAADMYEVKLLDILSTFFVANGVFELVNAGPMSDVYNQAVHDNDTIDNFDIDGTNSTETFDSDAVNDYHYIVIGKHDRSASTELGEKLAKHPSMCSFAMEVSNPSHRFGKLLTPDLNNWDLHGYKCEILFYVVNRILTSTCDEPLKRTNGFTLDFQKSGLFGTPCYYAFMDYLVQFRPRTSFFYHWRPNLLHSAVSSIISQKLNDNNNKLGTLFKCNNAFELLKCEDKSVLGIKVELAFETLLTKMEDVRKKAWLNHAIIKHLAGLQSYRNTTFDMVVKSNGLPHDYMQLLRPTKDPTSAWHETVSGSSATVSAELAHRLDQQECSLDSRLLNFQELAETASKYDAITGDVFRMSKMLHSSRYPTCGDTFEEDVLGFQLPNGRELLRLVSSSSAGSPANDPRYHAPRTKRDFIQLYRASDRKTSIQ